MKKFIFAALCLAAAVCPAMAEENYQRVSVGYDATFVDPKGGDGFTLNGFGAQYTYGISFAEKMAVELGGKLSYSTGKPKGADDSFKFFTIAVPVNYVYKFNINDNFSLAPYTGLNFKVHAMGKYGSENLYGDDSDFKRFQMGWQIGVGANISKFFVGLQYGIDFIKIDKYDKTSGLAVNVGYTF